MTTAHPEPTDPTVGWSPDARLSRPDADRLLDLIKACRATSYTLGQALTASSAVAWAAAAEADADADAAVIRAVFALVPPQPWG